MNAMKVVFTVVLSFLLFLSLSLLSIAVLLQSTILNPDFTAEQADRIDLEEIVRDFVDEEITTDIPEEAEFIVDTIYKVIDRHEPWIKEQLRYAIYTTYDYLQGRTDGFRLVISLGEIKSELKEDLWESLSENPEDWLPTVIDSWLIPYVNDNIADYSASIPEGLLPPEINRQDETSLAAYLENYLRDISRQVQSGRTTPEITGLLESLARPFYDRYYDEIIQDIDDEYVVDNEVISPEAMEQIRLARTIIGYFPVFFYGLIGLIVLLVAGIILINRNVKVITRSLGIDLIVFGVFEFAGIFFLRSLNILNLLPDISSSLESWLNDLYRDLLLPLQWFGLGVLIIGVLLLVVSFVYRPRAGEDS